MTTVVGGPVLDCLTLSEAYESAALDATNKIRALDAFAGGAKDGAEQ